MPIKTIRRPRCAISNKPVEWRQRKIIVKTGQRTLVVSWSYFQMVFLSHPSCRLPAFRPVYAGHQLDLELDLTSLWRLPYALEDLERLMAHIEAFLGDEVVHDLMGADERNRAMAAA